MREIIPIIDLFAGPGGLGEGFTSYRQGERKRSSFKILVSVEKDPWAHRTLELRSFFRQFVNRPVPDDYYDYIQGQISREDLFAKWPLEADAARKEAMHSELGTPDDVKIYDRIQKRLERCGTKNWVLIGGPPCQAYSVIGRSRMRSANPKEFEKDRRHFLYREYLRIIAQFQPAVFVMENVKGLLSSRIGDDLIFKRILSDLKSPVQALEEEPDPAAKPLVYRIYSLVVQKDDPTNLKADDFIIEAERYGIPQTRHRVILVGVREDIHVVPCILTRHPEQVPVHQVLSDLPPVRSYLSKTEPPEKTWLQAIRSLRERSWFRDMYMGTEDLFGNELAEIVENAVCSLSAELTTGAEYMPGRANPVYRPDWFTDPRVKGVCNHSTRAHMEADLHRYLFASCYAKKYGVSPQLRHLPAALRPNHRNAQGDSDLETFDDRFRVQTTDRPATTITAHMAKDGHYNIHYDPRQCRSLTVREAARIQTFPDNYYFEGSRTQQYRQVGNAVPPLLAHQVAAIINSLFEELYANRHRQPR